MPLNDRTDPESLAQVGRCRELHNRALADNCGRPPAKGDAKKLRRNSEEVGSRPEVDGLGYYDHELKGRLMGMFRLIMRD